METKQQEAAICANVLLAYGHEVVKIVCPQAFDPQHARQLSLQVSAFVQHNRGVCGSDRELGRKRVEVQTVHGWDALPYLTEERALILEQVELVAFLNVENLDGLVRGPAREQRQVGMSDEGADCGFGGADDAVGGADTPPHVPPLEVPRGGTGHHGVGSMQASKGVHHALGVALGRVEQPRGRALVEREQASVRRAAHQRRLHA
mmetsp:Transcript_17265/g.32982  ORF Transcript_17265/g.32982 Transcript_17265/m.32982 type:complete len:205 (-) Transcript_17265:46-660(-)